jgi:hypothetical protein
MKAARSTGALSDKEALRVTRATLRPIMRILKRSGISDRIILEAVSTVCRQHRTEPTYGIACDSARVRALADILMVWAREPEFIDERGLPMDLNVDQAYPSFDDLLKKAQIRVPAAEALEQLCALRAVQLCDRKRKVRLKSRVLISAVGYRFLIAPVLEDIRRFAETVEHNVCEAPGALDGRMQRTTLCASLNPKQLLEVQSFARHTGQAFLEALDEKLGACTTSSGRNGIEYGAGVYIFVDDRKSER